MRKLVYVAKRYTFKRGDVGAFNWKDDKFISLLKLLDCSVCRYDNEDCSVCEFEVPKEDYKAAMDMMKAYVKNSADSKHEWATDSYIQKRIEATGCEPQELLELMQAYWREADKRDGYLHFVSL